ncbi:OLC1v1008177C1 [Oldenlandia corymbosa var. corymbosa]|uniref:OLC1v1008177C1 n=1 Tax=Oldenlandia corymbosa var. corymbosa TaxID=529605 RepID=A0AAV1DNG2_OLDCO|nr:OLC1v1008177C1 [Oldenlandia corymbosa var. corymbosa]
MVNTFAKEARLFRKGLLKSKRLSLQSHRRNKQTVVVSTVQINDAVTGKDARFTRKQILKGQLDGGMHSDTVQPQKHSVNISKAERISAKHSRMLRNNKLYRIRMDKKLKLQSAIIQNSITPSNCSVSDGTVNKSRSNMK